MSLRRRTTIQPGRLMRAAYRMTLLVVGLTALSLSAGAQTFRVLHYFNELAYAPTDGLSADSAGNLYGITTGTIGGNMGTVFRLTPHGSSWIYSPIYSFQGGADGADPFAAPIQGPDGALYGTTYYGGDTTYCQPFTCGTVYKLMPPATTCHSTSCPWSDKVIYAFASQTTPDGVNPESRVSFDVNGNLYGSTYNGGGNPPPDVNLGAIYRLTPSSGGSWSESILYTFTGMGTGQNPTTGVILDSLSNVYGTSPNAWMCGSFHYACGMVFELQSPTWAPTAIHHFDQSGDGTEPIGAPIWDAAGNMYGTTSKNSLNGQNGPTIWKLSPFNGSWVRTNLYTWPVGAPGGNGSLTMDAQGNLYGVQFNYQQGDGAIFKLTNSNGVWTYTTLHQFDGNDGSYPNGSLVVDSNGNVFGTTLLGGHNFPLCSLGCGVVFEISQQ